MNFLQVKNKFLEAFGGDPLIIRAPGRINLIGEHTDYNDGFVMPAAIDLEVTLAVAENQSDLCRFYALDLDQYFETRIDLLEFSKAGWPNYLMGVMSELQKLGHTLSGFDCVLSSDIPIGAGLSSSAAVECGVAEGLNTLFDLKVSELEMVKLCQRAENQFVGVNCGIMDQFASVFGKAGHVFRLDCRSLEHRYFPFTMEDYSILLADTQVKHTLASSEYNTRRQECERGVGVLSGRYPGVKSLRDVSMDQLESVRDQMDPVVFRRCAYVVGEIDRVIAASADLETGDLVAFGEKMYQTHAGLRDDYEVSCEELDFLVESTIRDKHVIGARMMGGGFGGCTINLVRQGFIDQLQGKLDMAYRQKFGKTPLFYEVRINDGVSVY